VQKSLITGLHIPTLLATRGSDLFVLDTNGVTSNVIGEYTTSGATINANLINLGNQVAIGGFAVSGTDLYISAQNVITKTAFINRYTISDATINASWITGFDNSGALAVSGSNLFLCTGNGVVEYTTSGTLVNPTLITGLNLAGGIFVNFTPVGSLDSTANGVIQGWAYDPDISDSINVAISIDNGPATTIAAAAPRLDVQNAVGSPNHGFSYTPLNLSFGSHTVTAYAIDSQTAAQTAIGTSTLYFKPPLFSESYYLATYSDVAAAVRAGQLASAWQHYLQYGQSEGRNPSAYFDEAFYRRAYPDVAAAVKAGAVRSGFEQFNMYGQFEKRDPNPYFSESYYDSVNGDVAAAIVSGAITSGLMHYVAYGQYEGRSGNMYYNEAYYLAHNLDVAAVVGTGKAFISGYQHFSLYGAVEGRQPSTQFIATIYLAENPDVAYAVAHGAVRSAWDHWMAYGRLEGRLGG
jgi:hypothetical protein